ncbi:hypothetical protein [Dankookia sp. P2]|uniref:hypothetical protein n=1 Tax=Dankookia sp. P2 TaxID=3423955 RepID=UPI003D674D58
MLLGAEFLRHAVLVFRDRQDAAGRSLTGDAPAEARLPLLALLSRPALHRAGRRPDDPRVSPAEIVPMTPEERAAFDRRRRQKNWAVLGVLIALVILFFFISTARVLRG